MLPLLTPLLTLNTCIIKVLVNNPCPVVKREDAFEDTMFLIDLLKQSREKEIKEKKVGYMHVKVEKLK